MAWIDKVLEEVVGFGKRTSTNEKLNPIVKATLEKYGFCKENGEVDYPFKLSNYLFFHAQMEYETAKNLIEILIEGLQTECDRIINEI